jgi:hypothetical protein
MKTIEALQWNMRHIFRLGQAEVNGNSGLAVLLRF